MGEGPDVGFLDHVFGFAVVAQDAAGDPVEPAIVRLHDRANGRLVAATGALDQFGVSGSCRRQSRGICFSHALLHGSRIACACELDAASADRLPSQLQKCQSQKSRVDASVRRR